MTCGSLIFQSDILTEEVSITWVIFILIHTRVYKEFIILRRHLSFNSIKKKYLPKTFSNFKRKVTYELQTKITLKQLILYKCARRPDASPDIARHFAFQFLFFYRLSGYFVRKTMTEFIFKENAWLSQMGHLYSSLTQNLLKIFSDVFEVWRNTGH